MPEIDARLDTGELAVKLVLQTERSHGTVLDIEFAPHVTVNGSPDGFREFARDLLDLVDMVSPPDAREAAPTLQAAQRSQFWGFLGDWEEWGPRIQVAGLPTCAGQAIAHLYGNHDTPYAYCPQCDDDALAAAFSEEPEAPQPRTVDMAGRPVAELDTRTLTGEQ